MLVTDYRTFVSLCGFPAVELVSANGLLVAGRVCTSWCCFSQFCSTRSMLIQAVVFLRTNTSISWYGTNHFSCHVSLQAPRLSLALAIQLQKKVMVLQYHCRLRLHRHRPPAGLAKHSCRCTCCVLAQTMMTTGEGNIFP